MKNKHEQGGQGGGGRAGQGVLGREVEFIQVVQRPVNPGNDMFSKGLSLVGAPHQGLLVTTTGTTYGDNNDGTNQYLIDRGKDGVPTQVAPWKDVKDQGWTIKSLSMTQPNTTVGGVLEGAGGNTPYNLLTANCIQSCSRAVNTSGDPLIPNVSKYKKNQHDGRPPKRLASQMRGPYGSDEGYDDPSKTYNPPKTHRNRYN
ncbi:hypothetical protein RhiirA4_412929, partial [Rhizophagus irregularis]